MRIVGGRWAGTDLTSPGGRVRPTAEQVRVRCMEVFGDRVADARVLELYAGTGAVGLEALSRGAASVDFLENNPAALHALKANVARVRARDQVRIFKRDALHWVRALEPGQYDLTFADPPYGSRQADRLVEHWREARYSRLLVVEHAHDHILPPGGHIHAVGDARLSAYDTGS